jgi:hypothetical protein
MEKTIGAASKAVMFYSIAFFFVAAGLAIRKLGPEISITLTDINNTTAKVGHALDTVNDPHKGTLMMLNQDIGATRSLITHADLAARTIQQSALKESKYLDTWDTEITRTLGNVNSTILTANNSLTKITDHTDTAVDNVTRLLQASTTTIGNGNKLLISANDLITNPDISKTLADTQKGSASLAGMAEETATYWHGVLHPTWPHKVYGFLTGAGLDAAKFLW